MRYAPRTAARQSGFSLIELMIAITLGLIILAALTTFFVQTSANRTEMERNTRQIENGRYAIDTMREDVALAGFFADTAPLVTPAVWNTNDVCPANIGLYGFSLVGGYNAPVPVFGYANGVGAPLGCFQNLNLNNDIFAIRRFSTEPLTPAEAALAPKRWYLQNSQCTEDDPLTPMVVAEGTNAALFTLQRVVCGGQRAQVWRLREQIYYLRNCSVCLPAPDGIPTLWRAELDPEDTSPDGDPLMKHSALVEGIEMLRVDYGIDHGIAPAVRDGLPDLWTRCDAVSPCTAAEWSNVTSLKIYVLSRNLDESRDYKDEKIYSMGLSGTVGPFNDKYKRHVYSVQVALPNRSGTREPQLSVAP